MPLKKVMIAVVIGTIAVLILGLLGAIFGRKEDSSRLPLTEQRVEASTSFFTQSQVQQKCS